MRRKSTKKKKPESFEERQARLEKNRKARERHWRKTNVSERTIKWMKDTGWL